MVPERPMDPKIAKKIVQRRFYQFHLASYSLVMNSLLKDQGGQDVSFDKEWAVLCPIVLRLLRQQTVTKQEWQGLFFSVHSLTSWADRGPERLHKELEREILHYVSDAAKRIFDQQEDSALLRAYIREWDIFYTQTIYLPMPFHVLEHTVSSSGRSPASVPKLVSNRPNKWDANEESVVRKMMLDTWNEHIFSVVRGRLQAAAMRQVAMERNNEAFDAQLVIGVRQSYVSLCPDQSDRLAIYRDHFEKAYIEATEQFYKDKAASELETNGIQIYMQFAENKLLDEEQRANKYLHTGAGSKSLQMLLDRCVQVLVVEFQDQILLECSNLIQTNDIQKLQLQFRLLDRTPSAIGPMLSCLENHIRHQGLADMVANAPCITTKYVEQLLDMFNTFSKLVKEAFYDDPRFLTARDKAFKEVVNDTTIFKLELPQTKQRNCRYVAESKCPELLANYCDLLLRKTHVSRKLASDDIDAKLSHVLLVLKYVTNKDVFMRFHKAHLARRLVLDMSADQEKEEIMVNRLREAGMPADFVNKLYRMLQDVEVNKDINKAFKNMLYGSNNNKNTMADMVTIKILNSGAWMRQGDRIPVSLPRQLDDFIPEVEDFYKKKHSGRKLQWLHQWSNATIQMSTDCGHFDFDVTTFQMAVLFAWNDRPKDALSFENLRLHTELPVNELRKTLWSLLAAPKMKFQLLLTGSQCTSPKDFVDSTLFWINQSFCIVKGGKTQNRGRMNLIGRLQLTTPENRETENDDIVQLRVLRVQEAIVKILKMRKRVKNAELQTELVSMLKHMFLPNAKMVKEQIEWLLQENFITRDPTDLNTFVYSA